MGFIKRWREASKPRHNGSGRIWDNVNRGTGNVGPSGTMVTESISTAANTNAYVNGPSPEPYLHSGFVQDPFRLQPPYQTLQPEIPVSEPWAVSSIYIQNVEESSGQFKGQVPPVPYQSPVKSNAPPMVTQRDVLYDAADPDRALLRFRFITPSQQYFNQRTPLPEFTTPSVPANMVIAGNNSYYPSDMDRGWNQQFVPEIEPRDIEVGDAPPRLLGKPINAGTIVYSEYDHRAPVKVTAPKRKKA